MDFVFKHPDSEEVKIVSLSDDQIQFLLQDQLADELKCDCEPVGETNVVECNCDEYLSEFELQDRTQAVGE